MMKVAKKILAILLIFAASSALLLSAACKPDNDSSLSDSGSGGSEQIPPSYEPYFTSIPITRGDIYVYGKNESLSTAQGFLGESIQGLFAQKGDSKYYHHKGGTYDKWLNGILTQCNKQSQTVTLESMVADYKEQIGNGFVLFDSSNAQSTNCARTIAGAEGIVMIDKSLQEWAILQGLMMRVDATAMTEQECFETYKDKLNNDGLVQQRGDIMQLTDYAIARKYFCYFVTGEKPVDFKFRNDVQEWCSGCAVYGWCPIDEGTDVAFSSRYGSLTLASDYCWNMSMLACADDFGMQAIEQLNGISQQLPTDLDKHYITIVNSDGDNLQCWYGGTFEREKYMGAQRGDFPMGWSISPALYSLGPAIVKSTYENAKPNDRFVCSVSGLGYTYPMSYSQAQLDRYCSILNDYIGALDLSVVKILDNGLPEKVIESYSKMSNAKGFLYCTYADCYVGEHGTVRWSDNGKPFVSCRATMWNSTPQAIAEQINAYPKDATTIEGYTYVNLHVWSMDYTQVVQMVELLDENVVVVSPETFIDLIVENVPHEDVELSE